MTSVSKTLHGLRLVAGVTTKEKIGTRGGKITVYQDSPLQGLWRTLDGQNRDRAVDAITKLIKDAYTEILSALEVEEMYINLERSSEFTRAQHIDRKDNTIKIKQLTDALQEVKKGINVLKDETYGDSRDRGMQSSLKLLLEEIDNKLSLVEESQTFLKQQQDEIYFDTQEQQQQQEASFYED